MLSVDENIKNTDGRPVIIWEGHVQHSIYRIVLSKANKLIVEVKGNQDAMGTNSWHGNVTDQIRSEVLSAAMLEALNRLALLAVYEDGDR